MEQQRLIEKHAARLGLPNLKVSIIRLAGTGPVTDGLLSGKLHFASGGAPGAMLLWDRTRGGVKSCFAMNATDQKLVTVRPELRPSATCCPPTASRMPAVKTSPQAIWLQMAAAQAYGAARMGPVRRADGQPRATRTAWRRCWGGRRSTATGPPARSRSASWRTPQCTRWRAASRIMEMPSVTPNTIYGNGAFREREPAGLARDPGRVPGGDGLHQQAAAAGGRAVSAQLRRQGHAGERARRMTTPGNAFTLQPRGCRRSPTSWPIAAC